jgi:hypothetical protein
MWHRHFAHLLLVVACACAIGSCNKDGEGTGDQGIDPSLETPPVDLVMPDLDGIDIDQAFVDALTVGLSVNTQVAWAGHNSSLSLQQVGCPDLYVGPPSSLVDDDLIAEDAHGTSWYDDCTTPGGLFYRGLLYWESRAQGDGDPESTAGQTASGQRALLGAGVVGDDTYTRFQFRGEASDQVSRFTAPDYERWTYSSTISATVSGTDAFDDIASITPGGWRAAMYTYASGGDADVLEVRGDVYMFEHRIQDKFDSVSMDIELPGPTGASPDACTLEPKGWIGIRDENAFWIDVVFLPLEGSEAPVPEYDDPDYTVCDGCGTVYVRGVEAGPIGQVCPDFESLWESGVISVPAVEDYVLDVRDTL